MEAPAIIRPEWMSNPGIRTYNGDYLVLELQGLVTGLNVTIRGRFLSLDGVLSGIQHSLGCSSDGTVVTTSIPIGDGWLLSTVLLSSGTSHQRGDCYGELTLRGGRRQREDTYYCLSRGYLQAYEQLQWPPGIFENHWGGAGSLTDYEVADPSAGADYTTTLPDNQCWRLQSWHTRWTCSGVAATRKALVQILNGSDEVIFSSDGGQSLAANNDRFITVSPLGAFNTSAPEQSLFLACPPLLLRAGYKFDFVADGIDAGDQLSEIHFYVERWIDPPSQ